MVIHDLRNPSESIHKGLAYAIEEHQKVINQIFQEAKHLVGKDLAEKLNRIKCLKYPNNNTCWQNLRNLQNQRRIIVFFV